MNSTSFGPSTPKDFSSVTLPAQGAVSVHGSAPPQAAEIDAKPVAEIQQKMKAECAHIIKQGGPSYIGVSNKTWGSLRNHNPEIDKKITEFQKKYPNMIAELKKTPWKKLKETYGDGMHTGLGPDGKPATRDGITFEAFREEAKKFQLELVNLAAKSMGIATCKGSAFGTAGYDSDIDVTLLPEGPITNSDMLLFKTLTDSAWTHVLGGLSGTQVDLETYSLHPAVTLKTMSKIKDNPEALQMMNRVELSMALTDIRMRCRENRGEWESFVKKLGEQFPCSNPEKPGDPNLDNFGDALQQMITEVDTLQTNNERDIDQIAANLKPEPGAPPLDKAEARKHAAMLYKSPRLMELSKQMDKEQNDLGKLSQKYADDLAALDRNVNADPQATQEAKKKLFKEYQEASGKIEIQLAAMAGLMYSSFDESLLTQSAYLITCENEGSQKSVREDESIQKQIASNRLQAQSSNMLSIHKDQRNPTTVSEHILGAFENLSKYKDKIRHSNNPKKPAVIEAAKYGERMTSGCRVATLMLQENLNQELAPKTASGAALTPSEKRQKESIDALMENAKKMHIQNTELERCKRQFVLNTPTTKLLLVDALKNIGIHVQMSDQPGQKSGIQIHERDIDDVIKMFDARGAFDAAHLSNEEKFNVAMSALASKMLKPLQGEIEGHIKTGFQGVDGKSVLGTINNHFSDSYRAKNKSQFGAAINFIDGNPPDAEKLFKMDGKPEEAAMFEQLYRPLLKQAKSPVTLSKAEKIKIINQQLAKLSPAAKAELVYNILQAANALQIQEHLGLQVKDDAEVAAHMNSQAAKAPAAVKAAQAMTKAGKPTAAVYADTPQVMMTSQANTGIDGILKARSGFERLKDREVETLHNRTKDITLEHFDFNNKQKIDGETPVESFVNGMDTLYMNVLKSGVQAGAIAMPKVTNQDASPQYLNLQTLWGNTLPNPAEVAVS